MSTNANLPAGFIITSINGQRCTQVPRSLTTFAGETSFAVTTTEPPAQITPSIVPALEATPLSPQVAVPVTSTPSTAPTISATSTPELPSEAEFTSSSSSRPSGLEVTASAPPAVAETPSGAKEEITTPLTPSSTSRSGTPTSATSHSSPSYPSSAFKGTTPTVSSLSSLPIAQSDVAAQPTSTNPKGPVPLSNVVGNGFSTLGPSKILTSITPTKTTHAVQSSALAEISSSPKRSTMPVVGGVIGSLAFVGLVGFLLWFLKRRRRRDSLLTPLTTGTKEKFYEIDGGFLGPEKRGDKWKVTIAHQKEKVRDASTAAMAGIAGLGASLKSKVLRDRIDTPSVDLNRGNSQFLDGLIPQHSRSNSSALSNFTGHHTFKDRVSDWWERFTENVNFNWRRRQRERASVNAFAATRSMKDSQANINRLPDVSQLLAMDDAELQVEAERRRASLTFPFPNVGSLGLDFSIRPDPFADPPSKFTDPQPPAFSKPGANPFVDPTSQPSRSVPKQQTYVEDIRRSRRLSTSNNRNNATFNHPQTSNKPVSVLVTSRYPSSIGSRDSYRDTVLSSVSTSNNLRRGKGRSDPFDLERPELWRPKVQQPNPPMPARVPGRVEPAPRESTMDMRGYPKALPGQMGAIASEGSPLRDSRGPVPRVVSGGMSRIASTTGTYTSKYSSGVSESDNFEDWGDPGPELRTGSDGSSSMWNQMRDANNVSPLSLASEEGVGKAM